MDDSDDARFEQPDNLRALLSSILINLVFWAPLLAWLWLVWR